MRNEYENEKSVIKNVGLRGVPTWLVGSLDYLQFYSGSAADHSGVVAVAVAVGSLGSLGSAGLAIRLRKVALLDEPSPRTRTNIVLDIERVTVIDVVVEVCGTLETVHRDVDVCRHVCDGRPLGRTPRHHKIHLNSILAVIVLLVLEDTELTERPLDVFRSVSLANTRNDQRYLLTFDTLLCSRILAKHLHEVIAVLLVASMPDDGWFVRDGRHGLGQVGQKNLPEAVRVCVVILYLELLLVENVFLDASRVFVVIPVDEVDVDWNKWRSLASVVDDLNVVNVSDVEVAKDIEDVIAGNAVVDTRNHQRRVLWVGVASDAEDVAVDMGFRNVRGERVGIREDFGVSEVEAGVDNDRGAHCSRVCSCGILKKMCMLRNICPFSTSIFFEER